ANLVAPVTFAVASSLRWALPITAADGRAGAWADGEGSSIGRLPAIQSLPRRFSRLAAHPRCRELHRFVDLDIAGAAAQVAGEGQHEAGQDRPTVEQHGAGAALAQLAAVLRAREPAIFPHDLEQRFVRSESDFGGLTVQLEGDGDFRVGHIET